MLKNIYDTFINLDCLEKVLLITLIISLLCKGVVEIICWVTCKNFNRDKSHIKPCIYLKRGKKQDCNLQEFKHKHFLSEECNKQKCPGYRTSNYSIDEIKSLKKVPFITLTICKWIADLSTVLLIIKTLFSAN